MTRRKTATSTGVTRRAVLQACAAGAAASSFTASIQRALAIPANNATGTINDVEHVIILTQENRGFLHYFGTMPGVRGFSDRFTLPMASGKSVWTQQGSTGDVQPYFLDASKGNAYHLGGAHDWSDQQAAWDGGRMAAWPKAKRTAVAMGYLRQSDLSFHWALADAFTVCDAYHGSISTGTYVNRMFLWTGTNGANVTGQACVTNANWGTLGPSEDGLTWTTYPERLQDAGVSWKVYSKPYSQTNVQLVAFAAYRRAHEALLAKGSPNAAYSPEMEAASPLYKGFGNTMPDGGLLKAVGDDIAAGTLPQVSWIVAPNKYNEHPQASTPAQGAWYLQTLLDMLTAHPEVWSRTVLIVNYDENDCFFDAVPPPAPPMRNADGTYQGDSTADLRYEYNTMSAPPADTARRAPDGLPFGAGPRLPTLVISPWSVGGWVNSQAFDHTSTLQFLERRFGVRETNISAWRRTVFGDMTSCFDFKNPNSDKPSLPPAPTRQAADALLVQQSASPPPPRPAVGTQPLPTQPRVPRRSRALPYVLQVDAATNATDGTVSLTFRNLGAQGAVFHVYDELNLSRHPRRFTVDAGRSLSASWAARTDNAGKYALWILGPNGFHRRCRGDLVSVAAGFNPEVRIDYQLDPLYLRIIARNDGPNPVTVTVKANAYLSYGPWIFTLDSGSRRTISCPMAGSNGWYDFTVTTSAGFERRVAGRMETGKDGYSDPAMGGT